MCAWPVSGQYGPGSRVLSVAPPPSPLPHSSTPDPNLNPSTLLTTQILCPHIGLCVARKAECLRNACLAAALLFPAVAAVHGIVLAAGHVNGKSRYRLCTSLTSSGAVDMDVFGAFQLCSIGILAAPATVRVSRTYFYDPGRNAIFLWTGLLLVGKWLSDGVYDSDFSRASEFDC